MQITPDAYQIILRESGCFDFLREPAKAAAEEVLLACPEGAELLSDAAKQDLENCFCIRMEMVYIHPLITKLTQSDPAMSVAPVLESRERWMEAAVRTRDLLGQEAGAVLAEEYPLIGEYASKIRQNYINSQAEMLRRVAEKKNELSKRLFSGQQLGTIRSISGDLGDLHRHGRSVRRIVTDAGAFYYKPHDCSFEALYRELVTSLFSDCTLAPIVVCGDGFGFEEELKPRELESPEQASEYFYNLGMLVALFHAIGSTDMHGENIMACGVRPAAVDLETLVRGKISQAPSTGFPRLTPFSPAEDDLYYSVETVGILPNTVIKGAFMSALHRDFSSSNISLPRWQGKKLDIIGCEEVFLQGFQAGYDRALANRGQLAEMIREAEGMPVRYVARNTTYYFIMRSKLFQSDALAGIEGRNAVLKRLEVPFTKQNLPVLQEMVDYEARCLTEGDIPYYCTTVDGHALCGEDPSHVLRGGHWEKSAGEVALCRLERLSPREKAFETAYIRTRLDRAPLPESKAVECPALPEEAMTAEAVRTLCGELLSELERDSLSTASGATIWHSGILAIEKEPSCGMVTQQADAALYCALVLSEPSLAGIHGEAAGLAGQCLRQLDDFTRRLALESREYLHNTLPFGLAFGMGGILLSAAEAAKAGLAGADALLERCLRLICEKELYRDRKRAGGEAQLVLALKALPGAWASHITVPEIMTVCAGALLHREPSDFPLEEALRAAALSEAYRVSGKVQFLKAADEAFRRVREAWLPHISGWAEKKPAIAWLASSGGQEGGIALCAMIGEDAAPGGAALEVRDLALDSLAKEQALTRSDTLHDGNALSVLALIRSAEIPDRSGDFLHAGRLLNGMVSRRKENGSFICSPPGTRSFFDVSVCCGTLGVGCAAAAYLKKLGEMK